MGWESNLRLALTLSSFEPQRRPSTIFRSYPGWTP